MLACLPLHLQHGGLKRSVHFPGCRNNVQRRFEAPLIKAAHMNGVECGFIQDNQPWLWEIWIVWHVLHGGGTASAQWWWNGGCRARACPNILSSSILKAGLEAPAIETKAGLEPDEWSATNQELRPHPRRSQPFRRGARLRAEVMSQFSSRCEMVRKRLWFSPRWRCRS